MKHYIDIDYDHFLDDVRDMYPFSILEAILTELIANALTTLREVPTATEKLEILENFMGRWGRL